MIPYIKSRFQKLKWIALFSLWSLQGVIALWHAQVVYASKETSPAYLVTCAVLIVWVIFNIFLMVHVVRSTSIWPIEADILASPKIKDFLLIAASSFLLFRICLWIFQKLLAPPLSQQIGGYLNLLTPLLDLFGSISLEIVILIFFLNLRANLDYKKTFWKLALSALFVFSILGIITLIISITGLGILPTYKGDWQRGLPAVALLEWQILLACALCLGVFFAELKLKSIDFPYLEILICVAIWLGASALWLSQPIIPNASALKPREPNFEIYPFNDAQVYDEFAQSALVGNGFGDNVIPQRPLYAVFLIFLHVLAGQDYSRIIFFQTLFFAIFPVMLYLFGREFFGRPIGISVALLAILRDYTSNFVSPYTGNLTYSKLYLSEIPTAILLILFLWIGIRWIKAGFPLFSAFLLGGILGSAMLIRTQVIVALPVIILFAFLVRPREVKLLIKNIFLIVATVVLVVSPWLWRNWNMTGELMFDNPASQVINLALRYSRLNGVEPEALPFSGESNVVYNARLKQIATDAIASNPFGALWGVSNSFINHGINNILLLPIRNNLRTVHDLLNPSSAFWEEWDGAPNVIQSVLLGFYIFLIGLGITSAWIRNHWIGLLPLTLNLAYNLWTSLALLSGQRFMLTMDWSIYTYYMIGLFALFGGFLFVLDSGRPLVVDWVKINLLRIGAKTAVMGKKVQWQKYLMFGLLFLGVGLSLPLSEKIFPNRYPRLSQKELVAELSTFLPTDRYGFNSMCLQKMADSNAVNFIQGRAIFPRYYDAGDGERFTDSIGYKVVDESRLVFNLVGQASGRYIFNIDHQPEFFPHASDVTLMLSDKGEMMSVFVKHGNQERFYVSGSFDLSICQ
jgi:hypothetical protein